MKENQTEPITWQVVSDEQMKLSVKLPEGYERKDLNLQEVAKKNNSPVLAMIANLSGLVIRQPVIWRCVVQPVKYEVIGVGLNPLMGRLINDSIENLLSTYISSTSQPESIRQLEFNGNAARELIFTDRKEVFCVTKEFAFVFRMVCPSENFDEGSEFFSSIDLQ